MSTSIDARYVYTEFDLDSDSIAMITDQKNEHAWIQSNVVVSIHR
jgi:hypothetical protein